MPNRYRLKMATPRDNPRLRGSQLLYPTPDRARQGLQLTEVRRVLHGLQGLLLRQGFGRGADFAGGRRFLPPGGQAPHFGGGAGADSSEHFLKQLAVVARLEEGEG